MSEMIERVAKAISHYQPCMGDDEVCSSKTAS